MTEVNGTAHAAFIGGAVLAHGAVIARLLLLLESKGVMSRADVDRVLTDAAAGFQHPQATEIEGGALGLIHRIRERVITESRKGQG